MTEKKRHISEEAESLIKNELAHTYGSQGAPISANQWWVIDSQEPIEEEWAYNEGALIQELLEYCESTYSAHYAGSVEPAELIVSLGLGQDYFAGNIIKYASRYGKKDGYNRKDIFKILHYALMLLYVHDLEEENASS